MGPLPPLLAPPTEPDSQEPEMPQRHMSIRGLLEVKPETNVVRIITGSLTVYPKLF